MLDRDRGAKRWRQDWLTVTVVCVFRGGVHDLSACITFVRRALPFRGERAVMRDDGGAKRAAVQHLRRGAAVRARRVSNFEEAACEVV